MVDTYQQFFEIVIAVSTLYTKIFSTFF